jgi:TPP-dependent pyruvate/acetoin dehydrogenase alpha subunit
MAAANELEMAAAKDREPSAMGSTIETEEHRDGNTRTYRKHPQSLTTGTKKVSVTLMTS